jgi:hypothetical protein
MKSSTAEPSLRNSGHDTYASSGFSRRIAAPVPAGTVLFITRT